MRPWAQPRADAHIDLASFGHAQVLPGLSAWERSQRRAAVVLDTAAAVLGVLIGIAGRNVIVGSGGSLWDTTPVVWWTLGVAVVAWVVLLARHGAYATRFVGTGNEEYRAVARAGLGLVAIIAFASFALQLEFSRGVLLVMAPTMTLSALAGRYALRRRLVTSRAQGMCLRPTVVVGDAAAALDVAHRIERDPGTTGMSVAALCVADVDDPVLRVANPTGIPVLGGEDATLGAVEAVGASAVAVASSPTMSGDALRRLGWALEQRDVDLLIAPGIVEVAGPRLTMRPASGLSMLHVERPVSHGFRFRVKRIFDRVAATLLLLLASPLFVAVAVMIRRGSAGPVFFTQDRVGEGGRIFRMWKFRTMVVDAEARLDALSADGHDGNETLFKMHTDPRVTRIGAVLRRYSLDELPQLFNVLRGEMSLIGPRPPLTREVDRYENDAVRRLRVRPGMTGLWQVSGRSDLSWVDSVRLDLWYVDNWSLSLDAQILVRTADAVLRGRGAY
ncbi:sugar transferase [Phycicoccus sp. BSK3Z-2]|uniref:Sugar transferase n=1 Tax=Phycicoccus avicenniae TaxID=2828860 RepID=A0A941HZ50_9MICO|nr:sugar transferase [Phycicoccus avicenniae]MBR7743693.1 sugar transferase [Phycicoccus avicenniae]